jgi:Flp pilus assembly protein TadB
LKLLILLLPQNCYYERDADTDTERKRQRQRQIETQSQTHRKRKRERERHKDRDRGRERERERERERGSSFGLMHVVLLFGVSSHATSTTSTSPANQALTRKMVETLLLSVSEIFSSSSLL